MSRFLFAIMALMVTLSTVGAADRPPGINGKLRKELKPLIESLKSIVAEERQTTISIGEFVGPPDYDTNFGPGLQLMISEELELLQKGIVKPKSDLYTVGKIAYVKTTEKKEELQVLKITLDVQRQNGDLVSKLAKNLRDEPQMISDSEIIASVIAPGAIELPVNATKKGLNEEIRRQTTEQKIPFKPTGSRIRANEQSPFGVEFYVSKTASPDAAGWKKVTPRNATVDKENRPAIEINRGEFYAIGLYNETKHPVAVTLNIDGIDVFAFSEIRSPDGSVFPAGKPKYTHFIIPPGGTIIPGWHKTNQKSATFEVTAYGEGASKLLKVSNKPGVITATFALAWSGDNVPEEEKLARRSTSGNETGFGPNVKTQLSEVQMNFGVVREIISVRYSR